MLKTFVYRPVRNAGINSPLPVRSAGHYCVPCGFVEQRDPRNFLQLFWVFAGEGRVGYDRVWHPLREGDVFCYFPNERHDLAAISEQWEYYWLTIDGDQVAGIVGRILSQRAPIHVGGCPVFLFEQLQEEVRDFSPAGQRQACVTAFAILLAAFAGGGENGSNRLVLAYQALVAEHYTRHTFCLDEAATRLGVHRSTLNRLFRLDVGMSPGEYLKRYRIREALALLRGTTWPVADVAVRCGFSHADYFARVIRKVTGMPPRAFRRGAF